MEKKKMIKVLLFVITLFLTNSLFAQNNFAEIYFKTKKHDFGEVVQEKDSVVKVTFDFENKGNLPLIIHKVSTSCGCASPEWTKAPVEKGGKGSITISFNPAGYTGKFSKSIFIKTNSEEDVVLLKIEGIVIEKKQSSFWGLF